MSDSKLECETEFKDCDRNTLQKISYVNLEAFEIEKNLLMPTYIKIDVEGMESTILKTMDFIFQHKIPIYCEVHHNTETWGPQNYENNPSFKTPEDGGFDFNVLKKYNYTVYSKIHSEHGHNTILLDESEDYNPPNYSHYGMLFV